MVGEGEIRRWMVCISMLLKGRKGEQNRHYCSFKDIPFDLEALC